VVLVVLRGVDAALRGDAVRAARTILDAEAQHVVAELAERRRGRRPCQPGADDDDRVLALVGRVHQLHLELVAIPLARDRSGRHPGGERDATHGRPPARSAHGAMTMTPPVMSTAAALPNILTRGVHRAWSAPSDWTLLDTPCHRCDPTTSMLRM